LINNLHTHTRFSDGSSDPADYIKEAISQGFSTLGISDHSPVPFKNSFAIREGQLEEYAKTITDLRKTTAGLSVLLGLEADYIPGITQPFATYKSNYPIDYIIGSVHLVKSDNGLWFIDGPDIAVYDKGLKDLFAEDAVRAVTAYYHQLQEMITTQKPDIIGHLDKIKMYNRNRYFLETDAWYRELVDETLDLASENGCVIEVNTRGIYKKRSETLFPGPDVLHNILKKQIPVTLTSDAHKPHELSLGFESARQELKQLGFSSTWNLSAKGWVEEAFRNS
jgi:histidinol-phosphatase (PHP family)